jgi:heterodisulfide reductase subunit A
MYTAKHAHMVADKIPDANVTVYYTDVRAFGKGFEEFYVRVMEEGVNYLRRELDDPIEVVASEDDGKVVVKAEGHPDIEADLVVLATAITQRTDIDDLAGKLKIARGADGFFLEIHPKLRPMDTATRGIFLTGCCQGPKDIPDTVAQASGAAAKAVIPLAQGKIDLDPQTSFVIDDNCDGCAYCVDPCPYGAITLLEYMKDGAVKKTVQVNEALCQGCGVCQATCPKKGIIVRGFTMEQINAMVGAALESI